MIALIQNMSTHKAREMRQQGAARRLASRARAGRRRQAAPSGDDHLAIRRLDPSGRDREALVRLAGRDSTTVPTGEVIGAEREGRLIAALSIASGRMASDPFEHAAAARSLLRHRARALAC